MRILLLAPQPFFEVRGTPLAVLALVRALTGLGHQVDLLTFPQGEEVTLPGLRHLRSLRLPVGRVRAGASVAKLLLDVPFMARALWRMAVGRYDVVHAVEEAAHLAAPGARLLRIPLVVDVDSSVSDQLVESGFARKGPLLWAARSLERRALRQSAAVITVCTSLTDLVRERAPQARVFQIEDPPLVDGNPPAAAAVEALRRELSLDARPVVLYSGNFEPYQGVPLLVEAAAQVPAAQFVFMGGEAEQVAAARRSAESLGCGERCVFTGQRPTSELGAFLALSDVLVSPRCRGVNTPFKIYTYLASGRPLVATRIPTHTQVLDDETAVLVEPTAEALAAGIGGVLADPAEARGRAQRGQALIEREYSPARYAEKVRAAYAEVAASAPVPAWPEWVDLAALAAVFLALTISTWGAWPDVLVDFGRELYVAWRVSSGDVLYRDVASFYGPLSPYVNAGVFRLCTAGLHWLVVCNLAILAGTTAMLRALLLRAGTGRAVATAGAAAFLALFGFGHLIANGSFNFVAPYAHEATHGFALAVAALLCALRLSDTPRWPWAGAAGLLCGLSFLTKPESFVAALGACSLVLALATWAGGAGRLRLPAAFAAGVALPPLVAWGLLATAMPVEEACRGTLGSWAYLGDADLRAMNYFGWSAGLDHPLQHLRVMARAAAVQAAVLLPALGLAWALRGRPRAARWVALACALALAGALAPFWGTQSWLRMARPLPFWTLGLLAASVVALWRARGRDAFPAALARTALAAFALLLLPRILLNTRFFHYGFVLSVGATLLVLAALVDWIPRALDRRGWAGVVFKAVAATAFAFVVANGVRDSHFFMARKKVFVGTGPDRFRADARGLFVNAIVENMDRVASGGTLAVLPEGVMINYLLRRPSSSPYLTMLPSDEAQFGEDELLGSLERRPPTLVVLVHRTTDEFGTPLFGRDYAQRTRAWIDAHYVPVFTVGDPPLEPGTSFGIRVLRQRSAEPLR